jgi:hypothetical protein
VAEESRGYESDKSRLEWDAALAGIVLVIQLETREKAISPPRRLLATSLTNRRWMSSYRLNSPVL